MPIAQCSKRDIIDTESAAVGQSQGYQKAASTILSSINQSADPCDNFFEFACGRWVSENQIPEDQSSYGHFHELVAKVELEMKGAYIYIALNSLKNKHFFECLTVLLYEYSMK
ncbi:unnamed protein product [Anisakis simplex]|uniref:Peptidase_M13_N domain-containing protein n=1 Tax=Anisakis simplex TaxID=6269 RepID=A0A0M3JP86_ANISI|nr:unnamed protein product [Anisakis simplex]